MTLNQLKKQLEAAGCSSANYHLGEPQGASDVYCLAQRNGRWHFFYTERGLDNPPEKIFASEAEACTFYYEFVMGMRHLHLVGFYKSLEKLQEHAAYLQRHSISTTADSIPYGGQTDLRYRLFVEGKTIFQIRQLLPILPLTDEHDLEDFLN